MNRISLFLFLFSFLILIVLHAEAQNQENVIYKPFVNQAGYNLGESKRFVCYGAPDNTHFKIIDTKTQQTVFEGRMLNNQGWFSGFNPVTSGDEYIVDVEGRGQSAPFWIADHLVEKVSSKLAYDFFADVRGYEDLDK
jgi:hypothetical protein